MKAERHFWYVLVLLMMISSVCQGQETGRQYKELFPVGLKLSPSAFHFGLGVTRPWGPIGGESDVFWNRNDTTYATKNKSKGGIGLYMEAGYTHLYKDRSFADQLDLTIALKQFQGEEEFSGFLTVPTLNDTYWRRDVEGSGFFDNTYTSISAKVYKHIQIRPTKYFLVGYGANLDYRVFDNTNHTRDYGLQGYRFPDRVRGQLHFRWGYGYYLRSLILMQFFVEMPLLGTDGIATTKWFTSPYVPMLFSVRLTWLKKPESLKCPPIKPASGEKAKKKDYLQELFHPDSKRHPAPSREGDDSR